MDIKLERLLDLYGDEPLIDAVHEMTGDEAYTVTEAVKAKNEPTER